MRVLKGEQLTLSRVKRLRSWSVPILCRLAFSWLMTALAMFILNFCRPMIFSSRVPRVIRRYTFTTRFCNNKRHHYKCHFSLQTAKPVRMFEINYIAVGMHRTKMNDSTPQWLLKHTIA